MVSRLGSRVCLVCMHKSLILPCRQTVPSSILIPACVNAVKGKKSPLTGKPIEVVAAGGIHNGQGLAAALAFGASAVWVGTRFIVCWPFSVEVRRR